MHDLFCRRLIIQLPVGGTVKLFPISVIDLRESPFLIVFEGVEQLLVSICLITVQRGCSRGMVKQPEGMRIIFLAGIFFSKLGFLFLVMIKFIGAGAEG
jgi:hypothetical protein